MQKLLLLTLLLGLCVKATCQVTADPATGQMDITSANGTSLSANFLNPNITVQLIIPFYNLNQLNAVPAGSCKVKINLGSKIVLDPLFNLSTAALSNYFQWSFANSNGNSEITGNLIAALPGDFTGAAIFNVKGTTLGTSIINTDFTVINNTPVVLTDEDPNNNSSSLQYTVTNETIPVNFTGIAARVNGCQVNVQFSTALENNVKIYAIEAGIDNNHFVKVAELEADNRGTYKTKFNLSTFAGSNEIFIRVKSIDLDGRTKLSETRTVKGNCEVTGALHLSIIPNPSIKNNLVTIISQDETVFNGHYQLTLTDVAGRVVNQSSLHLNNTTKFVYNVGNIDAGNYLLQIRNMDKISSAAIKIVHL